MSGRREHKHHVFEDFEAAVCQASPSSVPPRSPATAQRPPASHHAAATGFHAGASGTANPP
jgi:hypothetical protein